MCMYVGVCLCACDDEMFESVILSSRFVCWMCVIRAFIHCSCMCVVSFQCKSVFYLRDIVCFSLCVCVCVVNVIGQIVML